MLKNLYLFNSTRGSGPFSKNYVKADTLQFENEQTVMMRINSLRVSSISIHSFVQMELMLGNQDS